MFVELLRLACWSRRRGLRVDRIVDARVELGRREPLGEEVGRHVGVRDLGETHLSIFCENTEAVEMVWSMRQRH